MTVAAAAAPARTPRRLGIELRDMRVSPVVGFCRGYSVFAPRVIRSVVALAALALLLPLKGEEERRRRARLTSGYFARGGIWMKSAICSGVSGLSRNLSFTASRIAPSRSAIA